MDDYSYMVDNYYKYYFDIHLIVLTFRTILSMRGKMKLDYTSHHYHKILHITYQNHLFMSHMPEQQHTMREWTLQMV